jgi:hypothetical protein
MNTFYRAVVNDPKAPKNENGRIFANTKQQGKYFGMSKTDFYQAIMYNQIYRFEVQELVSDTAFDRNGNARTVFIPSTVK